MQSFFITALYPVHAIDVADTYTCIANSDTDSSATCKLDIDDCFGTPGAPLLAEFSAGLYFMVTSDFSKLLSISNAMVEDRVA